MEEFFEIYRRIREEMRRIIEEAEREFEELIPYELREGMLEPLTHAYETPSELVIMLDLPLVRSKDDISVRVDEDTLIVEASIQREFSFDIENPFFRSCTLSKYRKEIPLPENVDIEGIRARFRNGVLEIRIPKRRRGLRIEIE